MYAFLITTSKGLDDLLMREIAALCPDLSLKSKPGQVLFEGELEHAYRVCLWSRLANRVLLTLAEGEVNDAEQLYQLASGVNWSLQMDVTQRFVVDFIGTNRAINNSQFGAVKVKDAIVDQYQDLYEQRPDVSKDHPDIRIQCRLWRQNLGIYLDLSGHSLHQRHYRLKTGNAPVKEHIAAAMLYRSGWAETADKVLADPMCGAGTVAIEAALIACNIAPGLSRRDWGFSQWKKHQSETWSDLKAQAEKQQRASRAVIYANDIDTSVVALAKQNAREAGVGQEIVFSHQNVLKWCCDEAQPGYLVSNPPYGERLGELTELLGLFASWGVHLKHHFQGWNLSLLTSNRDLLRQMKLVADKTYQLYNGKLACQLVKFKLDEKNCEIREQSPAGSDFANRLKKNLSRLKGWLKNLDSNCYRIYDADLPEYNLAIDRYGEWVVVQEYAASKDIPESKTRKRLMDALMQLPALLDVDHNKIVLKVRQQQKGKEQYQKIATEKEYLQVWENGARFWVNLKDYLDTGLFLDHRTTRDIVKQRSKDKDVLNLFAYTGAVSVQAALGGAKSVTTVDMSKTYLEWAKRNFELNKLNNVYQYRFLQEDCLQWLREHSGKYHLIFIDPPSFSNSKRMQATWDVQRDHLALLNDARACLKPGGEILFSNNLRSFRLDEDGLQAMGLIAENISAKTLPEDFKRNPKIHHCWVIRHAK